MSDQGLDPVRRKPGLYIGGTGQWALNCCIFELIANSLEEHLDGRGSRIVVTIHTDGSLSITDEGGGISVMPDARSQRPFIELVMTTLIVPGDRHQRLHRALGLSGVGTKCVNAVSEWMRINTVWDGNEYQITFARGHVTEPLIKLPTPMRANGTSIRFKPDPEIFKNISFDRDFLGGRLDHLAILHPKLAFVLIDERPNLARQPLVSLFHSPNGIADFLQLACDPYGRTYPEPIVLAGDMNGLKIALGFQFVDFGNVSMVSYVNSSPTLQGGTHVQGFLEGLTNTFNELPGNRRPFSREDLRTHLLAFVAVWLAEPRYGGATKDKLINPDVETTVQKFTMQGIKQWAEKDADWLIDWLEHRRSKSGAGAEPVHRSSP